ncbi:hypothetical protein ACSHUI_00050 [Bacillus subtilis]|uniref:hypothetical protein n=1 Tax=Bacillus subtilis TaxID=1423 RepID=UPI0025C927AC|nr:hypothetical protein [Bacillus subtilis]WCS68060.1 hypothetical protein Goe26_01480 [Bacillus phage vB_BsuM-Goe26]GLI90895.1 hypothetical protein ANABIO4_42470 [Bacillus subtilis]
MSQEYTVEQKIKEILEEATGFKEAGVTLNEARVEKFIEMFKLMPYYSPDMEVRRDNVLFLFAMMDLANLQYRKEGTYGNSWERRKTHSIFANVARKFDRVETMVIDNKADEVGESLLDTVGDFTTYGGLWVTYLMRQNPEEYAKWQNWE